MTIRLSDLVCSGAEEGILYTTFIFPQAFTTLVQPNPTLPAGYTYPYETGQDGVPTIGYPPQIDSDVDGLSVGDTLSVLQQTYPSGGTIIDPVPEQQNIVSADFGLDTLIVPPDIELASTIDVYVEPSAFEDEHDTNGTHSYWGRVGKETTLGNSLAPFANSTTQNDIDFAEASVDFNQTDLTAHQAVPSNDGKVVYDGTSAYGSVSGIPQFTPFTQAVAARVSSFNTGDILLAGVNSGVQIKLSSTGQIGISLGTTTEYSSTTVALDTEFVITVTASAHLTWSTYRVFVNSIEITSEFSTAPTGAATNFGTWWFINDSATGAEFHGEILSFAWHSDEFTPTFISTIQALY